MAGKSKKVGGGGRFSALVGKLEDQGKTPDSAKKIAAAVGRKKYGKQQFQEMAAQGRKRAKGGG